MGELFRKKPLDQLINEAHNADHGFKRALSAGNLITLGIGAIIGTGIFVLTGTAAANHAGPALTLSFLISGLGCVFAGLCYAEFASMLPISGSAYSYSYASLGEFIAWIIGWDLILEYMFASSTVAVGWSGYVVSFLKDLNINLPIEYAASTGAKLVNIPNEGWKEMTSQLSESLIKLNIDVNTLPHTTGIINVPAMFIIAMVTILLVIGIKESARFNTVIVIIKLAVVLLFIGCGISYINVDNWTPYIPANTGEFGRFGFSGILTGAGVIFFAYIGFDAVSTAAQEAKNPKRDMPIGILGSLLVCTILYIVVAAVLTGMVNYKELNVPAPIALAIDKTGNALFWLRPLIKVGAIAGLSSVVLVMLMGQPRIFFSMSKDGLLPEVFSRVHKKYKTPHVTTILTGIVAAIIAGLLPIKILGELVSIGTLLAFVIVCASILVLRKKNPDTPRPFRTPWVPFVPIAGIVICMAQMVALPLDTWLRLIAWMIIGLIIYFTYSRNNSKLKKIS